MLDRKYGQEEDMMLDRTLKIATAIDRKRQSDLRYEASSLALQNARDKSARERESYEKMPMLLDDINNVRNNPELDPLTKAAEINNLNIKYPHLISTNVAASTMLNGALKSTAMDIRRMDRAQQDATRLEQSESYRRNLMMRTQNPEVRRGIAELGGVGELDALTLQGISYVDKAAAEDLKTQAHGDQLKHVKDQGKFVEKSLTDISEIKPLSVDDQHKDWVTSLITITDKTERKKAEENMPSFVPTLSDTDAETVRMYANIYGFDHAVIATTPPIQLQKMLLRKVGEQYRGNLEVQGHTVAKPKSKAATAFTPPQ